MVALFLELVRESLFIFFCLFSMAGKIFFIWDFSTLFFEDASKFLKGFKKEQGYVVYDKKPKELLISYYVLVWLDIKNSHTLYLDLWKREKKILNIQDMFFQGQYCLLTAFYFTPSSHHQAFLKFNLPHQNLQYPSKASKMFLK